MQNPIRRPAAIIVACCTLSATPGLTQDFDLDGDEDDIGTEEIIAGAVILGGLAAILGDDDDRYGDDYYYDDRYEGRYYRGPQGVSYARDLIERCVYAAENEAHRWGPSDVTQIEDVDRDGRFVRVEGDIRVADRYDRDRWGRYDYDDADSGEFSCAIDRRGRVIDIDFDGI